MSLLYPALYGATLWLQAYACEILIGCLALAAIGAAYLSRTTPTRDL